MITAKTYNLKGEVLKDTSLSEKTFGVKVKPVVIAQAVRVYLGNQRRSLAKTKTRSEVAKTTAKMYRQKGTGRARHGAASAPIFVGGGIAHGPTGTQNYTLKMPVKMKRLALLGALSDRAASGSIIVVSGAEAALGKTSETNALWQKARLDGKTLVISTKQTETFNRSVRNRNNVSVVPFSTINTYLVMANPRLLITKEAVEMLTKTYAA